MSVALQDGGKVDGLMRVTSKCSFHLSRASVPNIQGVLLVLLMVTL